MSYILQQNCFICSDKNSLMKFKILILIFGFLLSIASFAQRENDTIKTEKLIIIKQYSPTLNDAFKVRSKPSISDSIKKSQKTVEYTIFSVPVASTFTPAKGTASSISPQSRPYSFQNYARLGAGNFTNILGEFIGQVEINRYQNLQIEFDHFSSAGGIESEVLDNNFMDTALDLKFESAERYFVWHAGLGVDFMQYNWYGIDEEQLTDFNQIFGDDLSSIDPLQTYLGLHLNGGIDFESDIIKTVDFKAKNFSDAYNSTENEIDINSRFKFYISNKNLDLDVNFNFLNGNFEQQFNAPDTDIRYGFLTTSAQPSMQFEIDNLYLDLGLKGVFLSNTEVKESEFFVYPKINATYKFTEEFMLYAGVDGDLNANSYESVVHQNPFVSPTLFLQPTDNAYTGFAGVNGKFNSFSYNVKAFYQQENNYAFFIENPAFPGTFPNDFNPQDNFEYSNSFGLIYDDLSTLGLSAEANYEAFDDFNMGLSVQYFNFSLDNLPVASYLPELKLNLNANYQIGEKWFVHSTLFYVGERESLSYSNDLSSPSLFSSNSVDGFVDFNLGIDYQLNERIGLFLSGRNLLDNNYQQWRNFDVQGIQVMGGLSYQFDW
jgi:hypothetical protein